MSNPIVLETQCQYPSVCISLDNGVAMWDINPASSDVNEAELVGSRDDMKCLPHLQEEH